MKNFVLGLTAVAGIAASANAQYGFRYEFNTGSGWTSNATVDAGAGSQVVQFRVVAYVAPGTNITANSISGGAILFGRYTGSEVMAGLFGASGDSVLTNTGTGTDGFAPALSANAAYNGNGLIAGVGTRLGGTAGTSFTGRLLLDPAAYAPSLGGTPQLQSVIRAGTIRVGQTLGSRVINFRNNTRVLNGQGWYREGFNANSAFDATLGWPAGSATDINGVLNVIPTPGSLALLGLGGLVAARRRRA